MVIVGVMKENHAIEIDDENKEQVIILLQKSVDVNDEIININNIVKIEYLVLMHNNEVTVYYEDDTTDRFFNKDVNDPLFSYIKENGYNMYFESSGFYTHMANIVISFSLCIVSIIALFKKRKNYIGGDL